MICSFFKFFSSFVLDIQNPHRHLGNVLTLWRAEKKIEKPQILPLGRGPAQCTAQQIPAQAGELHLPVDICLFQVFLVNAPQVQQHPDRHILVDDGLILYQDNQLPVQYKRNVVHAVLEQLPIQGVDFYGRIQWIICVKNSVVYLYQPSGLPHVHDKNAVLVFPFGL